MNWIPLTEIGQLEEIDRISVEKPVLIFKHSTRCSISSAALGRLERNWKPTDDDVHTVYFLDLIRFRPISNAIADRYKIEHESPQALIIRNGSCAYNAAHFGVAYVEVVAEMGRVAG